MIFARHGETTGDIEDRYGGDYDDHLSEKGKTQSQQLAQELKDKGIQVVVSSPLIRAQETSKFVVDAIGSGCTLTVVSDVKERNQYGILTGVVKAEAKEKHPDLVEALKDRLNTIEGAESYQDFSARIERAFHAIVSDAERSQETTAVVWHGGPMRVLFRDILKWGEIKEIGDCSFVELEKDNDKWSIKSTERIIFDF